MPWKTVCKLQVLPPFPSYFMSYMNRFTCAVEAQLMVTQREHADNLSDRRDAATYCSHAENEAERVYELPPAQSTVQLENAKRVVQRLLIVCLSSSFLEAADMSDYAKLT